MLPSLKYHENLHAWTWSHQEGFMDFLPNKDDARSRSRSTHRCRLNLQNILYYTTLILISRNQMRSRKMIRCTDAKAGNWQKLPFCWPKPCTQTDRRTYIATSNSRSGDGKCCESHTILIANHPSAYRQKLQINYINPLFTIFSSDYPDVLMAADSGKSHHMYAISCYLQV